MFNWASGLTLLHLIGLAVGVGAATVKLVLLLRCRADHAFVPAFVKVVKPITRQIVLGLLLLTLSGIGWLVLGYGFTPKLVVKLVLVGVIWVLGPVIDNVVEPRFLKLAPAAGEGVSAEFVHAQRQYVAIEAVATGLFYAVIFIWVLV